MKKSRLSKEKKAKLIEHFVAGSTARIAAALVGVNTRVQQHFLSSFMQYYSSNGR
jgi:transposase